MQRNPDPIAYQRVVVDDDGMPVDYVFVDVNAAFESMSGRTRKQLLGKRATDVFGEIRGAAIDWIGTLGYVAATGESLRFEGQPEPFPGQYEGAVCRLDGDHVLTLFREKGFKSDEAKAFEVLLRQLQQDMDTSSGDPDFQSMTDDLLALSGAEFVALNIYEDDGSKTITRAISGVHRAIRRASEIMGFELVGKAWDVIPERAQSIRDGRLIRFDNLYESASGAVPRWAANVLEKLFDLGAVYVVELAHDGQSIGDFILFMGRDKMLNARSLIELYANQSGVIILRNRAERSLRSREQQFRTLAENSPDVITRVDRQCRRLYTNAAAERVLGHHPDELIGRTNGEVGIEDTMTTAWEGAIHGVFATGRARSVELSSSSDGDTRHYLIRLAPEFDDTGDVATVLSVSRDITKRKRTEDHIRWMSFHDSLTGLYNRRFLDEEMRRLDTHRKRPLSLIMADINGLKLVNDAYGHSAGDELLKRVAEIFRRACRKEDILGRWGGDEFFVLLPQTDSRAAGSLCARITQLSEGTYTDRGIPISVTLGHATKTHPDEELDMIIAHAEDAMYKEKLLASRAHRNALIDALLESLAEKSCETREHIGRMRRNAGMIAEKLALSPPERDRLLLAIDLHDVGQISVPKEILLKPGALTEKEWQIIKKHPENGYRIARSGDDLAHVAEAILHHHERWDGTGYPLGLEGESIPIESRVIAVADAFDAMTHARPYRPAVSTDEAVRELEDFAGSRFDPEVVRVFVACLRDAGRGEAIEEE